MIKQSKKHQYFEIFNENAENPASVWKLFKEIGTSKRKKQCRYLLINDCIIENSKYVANEFNNFFVNVASRIKEPFETFNFNKLRQFCNEKNPTDTLIQY